MENESSFKNDHNNRNTGYLQLMRCLSIFSLVLTLSAPSLAGDELLFPDDELDDRIAAVNEGQLSFIETPAGKPVHRHYNRITIMPSSLMDGWILLSQCHDQLDKISAVDIRFNKTRIRNIRITASSNIDQARVNGHVIELKGVNSQAKLCLEAESRALQRISPNQLLLRNGPFMRRFLDGFYPLQVFMEVSWPAVKINLIDYQPEPGGSGEVKITDNTISWSALFEGRLFTEFRFRQN